MRSTFVITVAAVGMLACQAMPAPDDVGAVSLAIAAGPPDASCLRVTVTGGSGSTSVRTLDLTPGAPTMATLSGLPLGGATVRAEAFNVACASLTPASIANWVSNPVGVMLTAGTPVPVQLVMQPTGQIQITVDWNTSGVAGQGGGGMGGGAGGGGVGGAGGLLQVAAPLNGQMYLMACRQDTEVTVCSTTTGACPDLTVADIPLRGIKLTDRTVTLGGTMGTPYTITLHVQGEVEAKQYTGSMDQNGTALSPAADGFAIGGTPTTSNAYGVYMLRVTNPGSTTPTNYFLNSLTPPGVSNHSTYGVDYVAQISAQGGATIRLVAADANCSQIKNCGPSTNGAACEAPVVLMNVEPALQAANPTFSFSSPYNGQWLGLTVLNVTSP